MFHASVMPVFGNRNWNRNRSFLVKPNLSERTVFGGLMASSVSAGQLALHWSLVGLFVTISIMHSI